MNERIKELWEQAHELKPMIVLDSVTCEPIHKMGHGDKPMYHNVFNPEKFAELIVKECANLVADFTHLEEMALDDYKEITGKEMILSTFGVE